MAYRKLILAVLAAVVLALPAVALADEVIRIGHTPGFDELKKEANGVYATVAEPICGAAAALALVGLRLLRRSR
jgi:hypothetical protein